MKILDYIKKNPIKKKNKPRSAPRFRIGWKTHTRGYRKWKSNHICDRVVWCGVTTGRLSRHMQSFLHVDGDEDMQVWRPRTSSCYTSIDKSIFRLLFKDKSAPTDFGTHITNSLLTNAWMRDSCDRRTSLYPCLCIAGKFAIFTVNLVMSSCF